MNQWPQIELVTSGFLHNNLISRFYSLFVLGFDDILFLMGLGFSLAAPIGPVNMEMIKRALQSKWGWLLGVVTGIGAMTGDFIIASVVLFVGDEYLRSLVETQIIYIILILFNIYILSYIGISALRSDIEEIKTDNSNENMPEDQELIEPTLSMQTKGLVRQYATGFVIVVTSPWSYFWWTSFGGYIINSGLPLDSITERLIVTIFFLSGILAWVLLLGLLLGISQRVASKRVLTIITKGSALIILGFAVKILYDALVTLSLL